MRSLSGGLITPVEDAKLTADRQHESSGKLFAAFSRQSLLSRKSPCAYMLVILGVMEGGVAGEFSSTPCQSIRAEETKCLLRRKCPGTCDWVLFHGLAHLPDDHSSRLPQLLQQPHNAVYSGNLSSAPQKQLQHGEAGRSF